MRGSAPRICSGAVKLGKPHTVTFDCWNTLIYEADESATREARRATFRRRVRDHGVEREDAALDLAFDAGWQRHVDAWSEGVASGAPEIARWALEALGHPDEGLARRLARELQQLALTQDVRVLPGARETLERLRERGVRRALI